MFAGLYVLYPARLYAGFALVDKRRRQRAPIAANTSDKRDPFPIAILYSRRAYFCLPNYLRKDAFLACSYANKEALLVHIVGVARLNVVLPHFLME